MFVARCACLAALVLGAAPLSAQEADRQLRDLLEAQFEWRKQQFPEFAMSLGDYRYADRLTDTRLQAHEQRQQERLQFLRKLLAIDRAALSPGEAVNGDLFEQLLRDQIEAHKYRMWLAPVGGRSGPQQSVPQMHERVRFASDEDYTNYLARLEQVPQMLEHTQELMRTGVREQRTPPQITLQGLDEQFTALLNGGLEALAEPFESLPAAIAEDRRQALRARFDTQAFPAVVEAMRRFSRFVVNEYSPQCRRTLAASALPEGAAYYRHRLHVATTTELSAQDIHRLGLKEVQRIQNEMMAVIRTTDFMQVQLDAPTLSDPKLFEAFIDYLRSDSRFYCTSEDELLRGYRNICKRIDAELPALFKTLPRLPYGVRKIPDFMAPSQTTAYYRSGDIDNAQPGIFFANTYALDQRPKYEMVALALHEAVPGHHLQIALAQELEAVPDFRRHAWITAFGEGWALYAERLGLEMGLFKDPYDNFGRLLYEMWRACRLVVDTGIHAFGWSKGQAVQYMREHTALSDLNINNEVDRYINWPGQATAYKIGELQIRALREHAEQQLGARFDVREFHDVVLGAGCVPLSLLERRVQQWLAGVRAGGGVPSAER